MTDYLRLLPTLVEVLAFFALVFCVLAYLALRLRGPHTVSMVWAGFTPLVTIGCVLALSGARRGTATPASIVYYVALALVSIGLPLAISARVMTTLASRTPPLSPVIHVLGAWAAAVVASPVALALIALVDTVYELTK